MCREVLATVSHPVKVAETLCDRSRSLGAPRDPGGASSLGDSTGGGADGNLSSEWGKAEAEGVRSSPPPAPQLLHVILWFGAHPRLRREGLHHLTDQHGKAPRLSRAQSPLSHQCKGEELALWVSCRDRKQEAWPPVWASGRHPLQTSSCPQCKPQPCLWRSRLPASSASWWYYALWH